MNFDKIPLIVSVVFSLFGIFILILGTFNYQIYSNLTSETSATIADIGPRRHQSGGQKGTIRYNWRITLRYEINGTVKEGFLTWTSLSSVFPYNEGDTLLILYNPRNPRSIGWVGTGRIGGAIFAFISGTILLVLGLGGIVRQIRKLKKENFQNILS